jgi:multiple antibiotic resistance protein
VILHKVFHVELYSLKAAGGIILFLVGLSAVQQGRFYDKESFAQSDISVVPLAAPLIAGPGTITAAISLAASIGVARTLPALTTALLLNLLLMLLARQIGHALERINATGPLIRITGLIVASVSAQMVFSGVAEWLRHSSGALP